MVDYPHIVKLDVGGVKYKTTLPTLQMYPDSYLGQLFSGRYESATNEDGEYFVDANGDMFRYILDFLRRGKLMLPEDFTEYELLMGEADFFQVQPLIEKLVEMKTSHDNKKVKTKTLLLVWGDHMFDSSDGVAGVYEIEYGLKAAYLKGKNIFKRIDLNGFTSIHEDVQEDLVKEGFRLVKKSEELQNLPKLCSALYTYGVQSLPKPTKLVNMGNDEDPNFFTLEVWSKDVTDDPY